MLFTPVTLLLNHLHGTNNAMYQSALYEGIFRQRSLAVDGGQSERVLGLGLGVHGEWLGRFAVHADVLSGVALDETSAHHETLVHLRPQSRALGSGGQYHHRGGFGGETFGARDTLLLDLLGVFSSERVELLCQLGVANSDCETKHSSW